MPASTAQPSSGDGREPRMLPDVPAIRPVGVLLHVGVHKTGTTAIQAAFADARPELKARGVLYPGKKQAQHRAALAVLDRTWGWKERGGVAPDSAQFDALVRQVSGHVGRVAVSSEFLCEAMDDTPAMVARELGGDRVHVVVTLRSLGRLLPSSWQQYLKYGLTTGYVKWLRNVLDNPGGSTMTPTFWRRNDHGAVVTRWAEAVGAQNVTVLVLEDVDRSAMFRTFGQLLDLPPQILESRMDLTSNRSMTAAEARLLQSLNMRVRKELTWDEYVKYVRRGVALGMVEGREPAPDEPRLVTPDWALDAAAREGAKAVDVIAASGVRVLGDLAALARRVPSGPSAGAGTADTVSLPIDAAVQAVMTVIEATRESPELTARQLRSELWGRTKGDLRTRWRLRSLRP